MIFKGAKCYEIADSNELFEQIKTSEVHHWPISIENYRERKKRGTFGEKLNQKEILEGLRLGNAIFLQALGAQVSSKK